jgi:hypothetical protein
MGALSAVFSFGDGDITIVPKNRMTAKDARLG